MAATILTELADYARVRVREAEKRIPLAELRRRAEELAAGNATAPASGTISATTSGTAAGPVVGSAAAPASGTAAGPASGVPEAFPFEAALRNSRGLGLICECKKASPSKGLISPDFPYLDIARSYEETGADCISVLTEPKWFLGADRYLKEIAESVRIPCLRKDFTVDPYMIYEAKCLGASAVLLIVSILDPEELKEDMAICDALGLSALVEAHDKEEIRTAVRAGARLIGVNNRNLKDFTVDFNNALRLREEIPPGVLYVAESGLRTPKDAEVIRRCGADAALVGEALMRANDRGALVRALKGEA